MNSKLLNGYITEEKFVLECIKRNIPISRPIFNVEPYDYICETKKGFVSVQVKKSWIDEKGRKMFCVRSCYPGSSKRHVFSTDERINYFVIYVNDDEWYVIPREKIEHIKTQTCVSNHGPYKQYLNNFEQFR